ncbi:MAG: tryptophan--tRNA ligase [Bdellovibrionales bacterium]|nr:tryptophan--tRNA ligase [Bdellovibrionales bacterium]
MHLRSLTGIRASGNLHIGNYLGTIKPAISLQNDYQCLYFVADMHALTTNRDPHALESQSLDIVAAWLALGLDVEKHIFYRQSDVSMVCEFAWYLSCVTGFGFLEKGHAFKDSLSQSKDVNHGVFAYPVLMAADILMYDADIVPVGKDQKQHVEMSRDMAGSFNAIYGNIIKLPEVVIDETVMSIPGLDGRKMSKSYNNEIPLFIDESALRKKIMSIKTDSSDVNDVKELDDSLVGQLFGYFASKEQYADLRNRLAAGGLGWGHAKQELFEAVNTELRDARERFYELRRDDVALHKVLRDGAERAFEIALPVLNRVRKAVGFTKFDFELAV